MSLFGNRIKKLRIKDKKTQKEFGNIINVSESTVGMYERNERKPDYDTLQRIADYFDVSIDFLLTGKDGKKSDDIMYKEFLKPDRDNFFKELLDAPEERIEEMKRIWEILKERDGKNE